MTPDQRIDAEIAAHPQYGRAGLVRVEFVRELVREVASATEAGWIPVSERIPTGGIVAVRWKNNAPCNFDVWNMDDPEEPPCDWNEAESWCQLPPFMNNGEKP